MERKLAQSWRLLLGPTLTLIMIGLIELMLLTPYHIPNPPPILMMVVIYSAFLGGRWSGAASALITMAYISAYFSEPGDYFNYSDFNGRRMLVLMLTIPATTWMVASLRDGISNKKEMISRLNEKLQTNLLLTSNAIDIICAVNRNGRFIEVNEACTRVLGYSREELMGRGLLHFVYAEDAVHTSQTVMAIMNGAAINRFENRYLHKSGKLVDLSWTAYWSNEEKLMIAVGRDVTDLKEAQRKLDDNEQRYRSLFDFHPDGVCSLDMAGNFISGNSSLELLTGYRSNLMSGRPFLPIVAEVDRERVWSHFCMATKGLAQTYEMTGYKLSGEKFYANVTNLPIIINGTIVGVFCIAKDIGPRMASEAELRTIQNRLVQSEKLASIGQLAAGVAHEINNPIGYVNSNLTVLARYTKQLTSILEAYRQTEIYLDEESEASRHLLACKRGVDVHSLCTEVLEVVSDAKEGVSRVSKIVELLRDFSRVDKDQECARADLHQALDMTLEMVNNEIKYKADVIKCYGNIPMVECVIGQINQVFMNLLVNAAHAIDKKGTITITTDAVDGEVHISISDTGCGIAPENIGRIFDPFFTTKPVGKGTGLGLSISYGIVQKHHGRIDLHSELGKGSTFTVVLPVHAQTAVRTEPPGYVQLPPISTTLH